MNILLMPWRLVGLILQSISLAIGQIWANKLRSILTTLGIIIGVAAVTAVIAGMKGMEKYVLDEFQSFGTNKIYVIPDRPETGRHANASWRQIMFRPEHFDGWEEECVSVSALTRVQTLRGNIRYGEKVVDGASLTGIEPDWHKIEDREIIQGRTFTLTDQSEAQQVCIISTELRDELRLDRDCTGQSILISNRRFTVVGLIEPSTQEMIRDTSNEAEVFIPFSTSRKMSEGWMMAIANSASPEQSDEAVAELRAFLRNKRGLRPGEPDTFRLEVMAKFIEDFKQMANVMTMVAGGIVAISLLVGGIGIMNIMLVSVSERTREIGLRKAVGAPSSAILFQFLVEAITLCFIGGLVGVLGGEGLTLALKQLAGTGLEKAYIPLWAIGLAFGFSSSVGVIFGMFPAIKAARLDPIEALRHE